MVAALLIACPRLTPGEALLMRADVALALLSARGRLLSRAAGSRRDEPISRPDGTREMHITSMDALRGWLKGAKG